METLRPVWAGEEYTITFVSRETGSTITGTNPISAVYGEAITGFPTASLAGYVNTWNTNENGSGVTYREGMTLATAGTKSGDKYALNLYARWTTADIKLTITPNTDSHITGIKIGEEDVTSGATKTLNFANELVITVTLEAGYEQTQVLQYIQRQRHIQSTLMYLVMRN